MPKGIGYGKKGSYSIKAKKKKSKRGQKKANGKGGWKKGAKR